MHLKANKAASHRAMTNFRRASALRLAFSRRTPRQRDSSLRQRRLDLRRRSLRAHLLSFSRFLGVQQVASSLAVAIIRHPGHLRPLQVSGMLRRVPGSSGAGLGGARSSKASRKRPPDIPSCCRCPSAERGRNPPSRPQVHDTARGVARPCG